MFCGVPIFLVGATIVGGGLVFTLLPFAFGVVVREVWFDDYRGNRGLYQRVLSWIGGVVVMGLFVGAVSMLGLIFKWVFC